MCVVETPLAWPVKGAVNRHMISQLLLVILVYYSICKTCHAFLLLLPLLVHVLHLGELSPCQQPLRGNDVASSLFILENLVKSKV